MSAILFCLFGSTQTLASQLDRSIPLVSTPCLLTPCWRTWFQSCASFTGPYRVDLLQAGCSFVCVVLNEIHEVRVFVTWDQAFFAFLPLWLEREKNNALLPKTVYRDNGRGHDCRLERSLLLKPLFNFLFRFRHFNITLDSNPYRLSKVE